jgi:hypothetical protein
MTLILILPCHFGRCITVGVGLGLLYYIPLIQVQIPVVVSYLVSFGSSGSKTHQPSLARDKEKSQDVTLEAQPS